MSTATLDRSLTPRQQELLNLLAVPLQPRPRAFKNGKALSLAPRSVYRAAGGGWGVDYASELPQYSYFADADVLPLAERGYLKRTYFGCDACFNLVGASPFNWKLAEERT